MENKVLEFVQYLNDTHGNSYNLYSYEEEKLYYKIIYISFGNKSNYAYIPKKDLSKRFGTIKAGSLLRIAGWNSINKFPGGSVFDSATWKNAQRYGITPIKERIIHVN